MSAFPVGDDNMRQYRYLIIGILALAVALMVAVSAWAQEGPTLKAKILDCARDNARQAVVCNFEVWNADTDQPILDAEGNTVVENQGYGYDKIRERVAQGFSIAEAFRMVRAHDISQKLAGMSREMADAPAPPTGLDAVNVDDAAEIDYDADINAKQELQRKLKQDFLAARDAGDCGTMRSLLDEAVTLFGADDSKVVNGESAYTAAGCSR